MNKREISVAPLDTLRANIGAKRLKEYPKAMSSDRMSTKILSSVIGVVATFAIGDLLLKRNYESYLLEKNGIEQELRLAVQEFDQLEKDIVQIVEARRMTAQRLNLYAASQDVRGFLDYYKEYAVSVDQWNSMRSVVQRQINSLTACSSVIGESEFSQNLRKTVMDPDSSVNKRHVSKDIRRVNSDEFPVEGVYSFYCPSFYLFYARPSGSVSDNKDNRSVFEIFQLMHSGFLANATSDLAACARETESLIKQKVSACHETAPVGDIGTCIKTSLQTYSTAKVCDPQVFGRLQSFLPSRFSNLDYRWDMARVVLGHYRDTYVDRRCKAKFGFWADFRQWNCGRMRANLGL